MVEWPVNRHLVPSLLLYDGELEEFFDLLVNQPRHDGFASSFGVVLALEGLGEWVPSRKVLAPVEYASDVDDINFADAEPHLHRKFDLIEDVGVVQLGLDVHSGLDGLASQCDERVRVVLSRAGFRRRPNDDHGVACEFENIAPAAADALDEQLHVTVNCEGHDFGAFVADLRKCLREIGKTAYICKHDNTF